MRSINIGQKVICNESGVIGTVIRFYIPTSCEEQTLVKTEDGRGYHAPTRTWSPYYNHMTAMSEKVLTPYGEFVVKFANNHGISISDASLQPMAKARLDYYNVTGK